MLVARCKDTITRASQFKKNVKDLQGDTEGSRQALDQLALIKVAVDGTGRVLT